MRGWPIEALLPARFAKRKWEIENGETGDKHKRLYAREKMKEMERKPERDKRATERESRRERDRSEIKTWQCHNGTTNRYRDERSAKNQFGLIQVKTTFR